MRTLQFTIPPSGVVQFQDPSSQVPGLYFQHAIIQNNNATDIRIGDNTVSATRGIKLSAGASLTITLGLSFRPTEQIWASGTSGDVVDVMVTE